MRMAGNLPQPARELVHCATLCPAMRTLLLALVLPLALPATAVAAPDPAHSAACAAALKVRANELAALVRAGRATLEPTLVATVENGLAFVGTAYLQGVSRERADALLEAALREQESMPPPQLQQRQARCSVEGAKLLADANALERAFVAAAARRQVQRLKNKRDR